MAPQNIGFVVIGLLYGGGDFGRAICTAVNCGDDSDCTGATVGSIMGILYGTKGIHRMWREPISEELANVAIGGFKPPSNIKELTDRVVKMAKVALRYHNAPVDIQPQALTTADASSRLKLIDKETITRLWARTPYQIFYEFPSLNVTLDYNGEPIIEGDKLRDIKLCLSSKDGRIARLKIICQMEGGISIFPSVSRIEVPGCLRLTLRAKEIKEENISGKILLYTPGNKLVAEIPLFFSGKLTVHSDDFALAKYGVRAESDSELSWEPGCTAKVNDGIIAGEDDFEGKRWHSALTPHPHWVSLILPEEKILGRVIIHFADPQGYPVDFDGEVSLDGKEWQKIFSQRNYGNPRRYECRVEPTPMRYFRLTIYRSASKVWENAAQISEIELLPK